jgi:hypothetical protein
MEYITDLEIEIHMQNEYNRVASEVYEHLKEKSQSFIGKKITTLKGLTQKFNDYVKPIISNITVSPLPGIHSAAKIHYISLTADTNLYVEIKLAFNLKHGGCVYKSNTFFIGKVDETGVLTEVYEDKSLKINTDPIYYEAEIMKIEELRRLENQIHAIKTAIRVDESAYKYI